MFPYGFEHEIFGIEIDHRVNQYLRKKILYVAIHNLQILNNLRNKID